MPTEAASHGDLYQVRIVGAIEGQETNNVLNFMCDSAAGDSDTELHLVKAILECFVTNLIPVMSSAWELRGALWKRTGPTLGNEFETGPETSGIGAGNGEALPSYCSALLSIKTSLGGRSGRGRMFLPGIPENMTAGSLISSELALWAALLAFSLCCVEKFAQIGAPSPPTGTTFPNIWKMGIYSRKLGNPKTPYTLAGFHPMVSMTPKRELATTRSRKIGHGR